MRWALAINGVLVVVLLLSTGHLQALGRTLLEPFIDFPAPKPEASAPPTVAETVEQGTFTFLDLVNHPNKRYAAYFDPGAPLADSALLPVRTQFHELLDLYQQRQSVDDNFTVRVVDKRTNEVLELYVLQQEKSQYLQAGEADWPEIDKQRRLETRRLVAKYKQRGIPSDAITVKWGRSNQIREAREREANTIEYEIRLADALGLSLLATEIGTVETFNQDWLVSSVGARSRYQMMPYVLRQNGIHHYELQTSAGRKVKVREEHHPLITLEPYLQVLRGYTNAVGHEIPGISSYHTGPGNIYKIYRMYLLDNKEQLTPESHVIDAYMWATTVGFDKVSRKTTFRSHSRGYVASAYGALKATEGLPIDATKTLGAVRVQVQEMEEIFLSELLAALSGADDFDWGDHAPGASLYNRFRFLNPHMSLPAAPDSVGVPEAGDVHLVHRAQNGVVRFFLPLGAPEYLADAGLDLLDPDALHRFDDETFRFSEEERTVWDEVYADLVADVQHFGFTQANREKLYGLVERFEDMAAANPTPYRLAQLRIIRTHAYIWGFGLFNQLADAVAAASGQLRLEARPLER